MNSEQRESAADRQRRGCPPAPRPVGLSTEHISPPVTASGPTDWEEYRDGDGNQRKPYLEMAEGGEFISVHIPRPLSIPASKGRRGKVHEFSRSSRRRLQRTIAGINRDSMPYLPLFITLTYPAEYSANSEDWKRNLDTLLKRIARRFPHAAAIWKLEFQRRGAPHFHVLLFNMRYLSHTWVARAWTDIVAPGNEKHLKAGTEVRRVKSWSGVAHYAAKYMSKKDQSVKAADVGRHWGVFNRAGLPIKWIKRELTWLKAFQLRRIIYRRLDKEKRGPLHRGPTHGGSMFARYALCLRILDLIDKQPPTGSFLNLPAP